MDKNNLICEISIRKRKWCSVYFFSLTYIIRIYHWFYLYVSFLFILMYFIIWTVAESAQDKSKLRQCAREKELSVLWTVGERCWTSIVILYFISILILNTYIYKDYIINIMCIYYKLSLMKKWKFKNYNWVSRGIIWGQYMRTAFHSVHF